MLVQLWHVSWRSSTLWHCVLRPSTARCKRNQGRNCCCCWQLYFRMELPRKQNAAWYPHSSCSWENNFFLVTFDGHTTAEHRPVVVKFGQVTLGSVSFLSFLRNWTVSELDFSHHCHLCHSPHYLLPSGNCSWAKTLLGHFCSFSIVDLLLISRISLFFSLAESPDHKLWGKGRPTNHTTANQPTDNRSWIQLCVAYHATTFSDNFTLSLFAPRAALWLSPCQSGSRIAFRFNTVSNMYLR